MLTSEICKYGIRRWICQYRFRNGLLISVVTVFLLTTFVSSYTSLYTECFLKNLEGPILADNPELLAYIRNEVLEPPSKEPYNLTSQNNKFLSMLESPMERFYIEHLPKIFKNKRNGFFIEAGALDGEIMSNTLQLEMKQEWSGLLVEADSVSFGALRGKHRKAWAANICLSNSPYPSKELFEERIQGMSSDLLAVAAYKQRAMSKLMKFSNIKEVTSGNWRWVQCIPLQSLLLALDVSKVDLLLLDVEGAELSILEHFDLDKFNVQVLCMEWKKVHEIDNVVKRFENRGYSLIVRQNEDLIFAKAGSPYEIYRPI